MREVLVDWVVRTNPRAIHCETHAEASLGLGAFGIRMSVLSAEKTSKETLLTLGPLLCSPFSEHVSLPRSSIMTGRVGAPLLKVL